MQQTCAGGILSAIDHLPESIQSNVRGFIGELIAEANENWALLAFTLANSIYETNASNIRENILREDANKKYGFRGNNLGNRPGTDDGYNFRGTGLVQLTGRDIYTRFTATLNSMYGMNLDLVNNPEQALNQTVAIRAALIGIGRNLFTQVNNGKNTFESYRRADGTYDWYNARELINGDKNSAREHLPESRNTKRVTAGRYVSDLSQRIFQATRYYCPDFQRR